MTLRMGGAAGKAWGKRARAKAAQEPTPGHITPYDAAAVKRPPKFGNRRVEVDGEWFDSAKEARRWSALRLMERAGEIRNLRRQVRWPLTSGPDASVVAHYVADFDYEERQAGVWQAVTEDVKGGEATRTDIFKLKAKMFALCHDREIRIT